MLTTRFKVWLQNPRIRPEWTGVKVVGSPKHIEPGCLELTVEGNGNDLRRLIAERRIIFAAYLQMRPESTMTISGP